jgi:hypothetical protein
MSNTLFLVSDVWENLKKGIVVLSENGKHAFYTTNLQLIQTLKGPDSPALRGYDEGEDFEPAYGIHGLAFNVLTKQDETLLLANFGGVISTVAFAEVPPVDNKKFENSAVGYKVAVVLGEETGALSVSTRFLEKFNDTGLVLTDIGVKDDKVVVLPAFAHIVEDGSNGKTQLGGLYLLQH